MRIFPLDLEANQQLSIRVAGNNGLAPSVVVTAPDGTNLGSDGSGAAFAVLQSLPVSMAGEYAITVSGASTSTGGFSLEVLLNGSFESERTDGIANDSLATSAAVGAGIAPGTFASTTLGDADRVVVAGSLVGEGDPVFADGFESGSFSGSWTTSSSNSLGLIELTDAYGADSGSNAMIMSVDASGTYNLNEAIVTMDLSTTVSPVLNFSHTQFSDETDTLPDSFTGSVDGDGVAISVDGTNWYTILNAPTTPADGQWVDVTYDLNEVADSLGITLGSNVQVKFQQYDNYEVTTDGRGYDSVEVLDIAVDSAQDWYSFVVAEQQSVSLAAQSTTTGDVSLALYDNGGSLLAAGSPTDNYDSHVDRYSLTPGTYYAKIGGVGVEDYVFAVGRDLALDAEANDDAATAQDISGTQGVLGSLGFDSPEGIVDPDAANDGDDISSFFPGITLSENVASGSIYAAAAAFAPTGSLVFAPAVGSASGFSEGSNEFRADFSQLVPIVTIDVGSDDASDVAFLRAYDSAGNLLDEQVSGSIANGDSETLTIQRATAEIAYVIAAGVGNDITPLDNLVVGTAENDADVYEVDISSGQLAEFSLLRLGSDAGLFDTNLDASNTQISLYSPGGVLIATDADTISHEALETGAYRIEVETTVPVAGTYYLHQSLTTDTVTAVIEGTHIFYDYSGWDGGANGDDGAIAPDKSVFSNGETATFANYSSVINGITGVMIDVEGLAGTVTESDFTFRVGLTDDTSTWSSAPATDYILTQAGGGVGGADRVILDWQVGSITNTWLQVTMLANANTGLAEDYVFYFGNVVGDTGNDPNSTLVNLVDVAQVRINQSGFGGAAIDSPFDVDRDGRVDLVDVGLTRANQSGFNAVPLITPTGSSSRSSITSGDVKDSSLNNKLFSTAQVATKAVGQFASAIDLDAKFSVSTIDEVKLSGAKTISSNAFEATREDSAVDFGNGRDTAFESLSSLDDALELTAF